MIAPRPLHRADRRAAARMYGAAFADDPGWTDVGPASRARRLRYARRICGGELRVAERLGGTVLATYDDGEPSAAIVYYPPGVRARSWRVTLAEAPGAVLAGPAVLRRSLAADSALSAGHPGEPHLFVSLLAAHPDRQRGGRGRALLQAALDEAERLGVPAYLDTGNPANLPYYRSFGFVVTGEARLPRGAPLWYLQRG